MELLESSRRQAVRTGDPYLLGWIVKDIADAALRVGKVDDALGLIEESIDILEPTGWKQGLAAALTEVGRALVAEDRVTEAVVHHRRALRIATDLGQPYAIADAWQAWQRRLPPLATIDTPPSCSDRRPSSAPR